VHEISSGVIYKDANVTVTAFPTKHAFPETYGYRFDTADRSIVISGDTTYSQTTIDACHGCDVLIHEASTLEWLAKRPDFQPYAAKYHTNTTQLAELASKAKPRLLIIYHCDCASASAAPPSVVARRAFERGALRLQRRSGCCAGSRCLLRNCVAPKYGGDQNDSRPWKQARSPLGKIATTQSTWLRSGEIGQVVLG
jgi:hypothetical protein